MGFPISVAKLYENAGKHNKLYTFLPQNFTLVMFVAAHKKRENMSGIVSTINKYNFNDVYLVTGFLICVT